MFKFFLKNNKKISRVVVLGSGGFIGKELCKVLSKQKIKTLAINRKKIDLKYKKSINKLSQILKSFYTVGTYHRACSLLCLNLIICYRYVLCYVDRST